MEANVRNKILYLIQAWAHAFRNEPKYKVVQDTYQIMKVEGESWGRDTASRSWGAALPQVGPQEAVFSLCGRGQRLTVTSCRLVEWVSPRWVCGVSSAQSIRVSASLDLTAPWGRGEAVRQTTKWEVKREASF